MGCIQEGTIKNFRQRIDEILLPLFRNVKKVYLFDFPNHSNIGDNAIYYGEIMFCTCNRLDLNYVETVSTSSVKRWYVLDKKKGVILLHGGGNFGDIWLPLHEYRLRILSYFRDSKIIQLPQTVFFKDKKILENTKRVIGQCRDFTLLVRDSKSFEFAKKYFDCNVFLCPDMAFGIPIEDIMDKISNIESDKILCLKRNDKEDNGIECADECNTVEDWVNVENKKRVQLLRKFIRLYSYAPSKFFLLNQLLERCFYGLSQELTVAGLTQLNLYDYIFTNRLHAHIFSLLLGKPHTIVPDKFGKIKNFYYTWTKDIPWVELRD